MQLFYKDSPIQETEELTNEELKELRNEVQSPNTSSAQPQINFPIVFGNSGSLSLGTSVYHLDDLYQLFLK